MAVAIRRMLFGSSSMFEIGNVDYNFLPGLPYYIVLGLLCGLARWGFHAALEKLEDFFDHLKAFPIVSASGDRRAGIGHHGIFSSPRAGFGLRHDSTIF